MTTSGLYLPFLDRRAVREERSDDLKEGKTYRATTTTRTMTNKTTADITTITTVEANDCGDEGVAATLRSEGGGGGG